MTSKEIQQKIIELENQIEQFGEMITLTNQLSILKSYKQDLERLEVLEELGKGQMNYIKEQCSCIDTLTQENEKRKKVIKIIKRMDIFLNQDEDFYDGSIEICGYLEVSEEVFELLKEVLGE